MKGGDVKPLSEMVDTTVALKNLKEKNIFLFQWVRMVKVNI